MTEPTPKPSDWSALDLPVLTEVADESAVPTLGAEASLDVPEFIPPASSSKPAVSPVPDLKLELPPDLELDELLEEDLPPPLSATAEFAQINLPSLDLEEGNSLPLDELLPTLGPPAYVNNDVAKPASPATSEQDFEFDLNLEQLGAASVVEPETLLQPHSHAELEEFTEVPERWSHPTAPAASPELAASQPAPATREHTLWDELPLSDNWDVAPPDMPASVLVDLHSPALVEEAEAEQVKAADQAQPVTVESTVPVEAVSPVGPAVGFGSSPVAFTSPVPNEPQPEADAEAAQDFEFLLEPESEPVASSGAIPEQEAAIPDFEFAPPHRAVLTEQEAEIAAEAVELSFEPVTEPEAAIHVFPEPAIPPELAELDFESMAEPELAAPLAPEFFAAAERPPSETSAAEQPATEIDSARVSEPESPTEMATAPAHEVSTEEALSPELAALAATEPSWLSEVVQEAESADTVAAAEPLVPELTEPAATETDVPPAAAFETAAAEQEEPEFEAVELSFASAVEPEPAARAPHTPPPQSIDIDSLQRGVLNSPLTAQHDPMSALQERLAEIHANLDSVRQESSLRRDPAAEVAHSLTKSPLQSAKDSFAATRASEEAFPPESFPDLASVAEPAHSAPDAHGEAVAVVGEDVLIESLYHRILPRMKVELGLWLQDALALQSKQLLSGVMQQLKEDYDQMFGETLRESLRQALADVARIEHKDKDQE
jgi:hypothetical protein